MSLATLTLQNIRARPVMLKLKRPVVARIATLTDWPLILIDLYTEEGVIGRAYLEPYVPKSMRYLIPALHDLREMLKGRRLAPIEFYEAARKSLHFVGYEGMAMIAVAGVDMAAWDALARAAGVPLCVLLGGSIGPVATAIGSSTIRCSATRCARWAATSPRTTSSRRWARHASCSRCRSPSAARSAWVSRPSGRARRKTLSTGPLR